MNANSWLPCRLTPFDRHSPGKPGRPGAGAMYGCACPPTGSGCISSTNAGGGATQAAACPDGTRIRSLRHHRRRRIHFCARRRSFVTSIATGKHRRDSRFPRDAAESSRRLRVFPTVRPMQKCTTCARRWSAKLLTGGPVDSALDSGQRQRLLPDSDDALHRFPPTASVGVCRGGWTRWHSGVAGVSEWGTAPRRLTTMNSGVAYFGARGDVVFVSEEQGSDLHLSRHKTPAVRAKIAPRRTCSRLVVSPDGRWVPGRRVRRPRRGTPDGVRLEAVLRLSSADVIRRRTSTTVRCLHI